MDDVSTATTPHLVLSHHHAWQIGIILSANYTFLNYLVLALGILVLDDQFMLPWLPRFMKELPGHERGQAT